MPEVINLLAAPTAPLPSDAVQIYRPASAPGGAPTPLVGLLSSLPATLGGRTTGNLALGSDTRFPDELTLTTIDASQQVLSGLRAASAPNAAIRTEGHVLARNSATGGVIAWDVSALVKLYEGAPSIVGVANVAVFAADAAMSGCTVTVATTPTGVALIVTGLAGATILWTGALLSKVI